MRGADASSSLAGLVSLPAFWTGLLYDATALAEASALVADWSLEELMALRDAVPRLGLEAPFRGDTVLQVAREAVAIAERGLMRRAQIGPSGEDERVYLAPLLAIVREGRAPADRLLAAYEHDWGGDIDRLFDACAF
jgi:glutamate--cysteine ligase